MAFIEKLLTKRNPISLSLAVIAKRIEAGIRLRKMWVIEIVVKIVDDFDTRWFEVVVEAKRRRVSDTAKIVQLPRWDQ